VGEKKGVAGSELTVNRKLQARPAFAIDESFAFETQRAAGYVFADHGVRLFLLLFCLSSHMV
jgi:hypothetical protein